MVNTNKRLNELDGKTWLKYSFSIWRDIRKDAEETKLKHPALFPVELASRLIKIFTHKNDLVLDPFMGCGSTVIAAILEGRVGIGLELSEEYFKIAEKRVIELESKDKVECKIYNDDARNLLNHVTENSIDFCLTSPPYWDILNMNRTADRKQIRKYSDSDKDLGNIHDYQDFLNELKNVFRLVYKALKIGGFCVVVVMDIRKKNKFYPFHSDLANAMTEIGFTFEDIIIWDRQHEYNSMKPLGYPYMFRVNKVHEYILIFRRIK
ncbi:MAG: DNA methyltransferase [Caldisphaera sp.]|nr:MAG: DNA methyltransferase [Caldisphaera sp.]HEM55608.1 site-specific DNA-methyltransferase [Thermodesulfobium narugense]